MPRSCLSRETICESAMLLLSFQQLTTPVCYASDMSRRMTRRWRKNQRQIRSSSASIPSDGPKLLYDLEGGFGFHFSYCLIGPSFGGRISWKPRCRLDAIFTTMLTVRCADS